MFSKKATKSDKIFTVILILWANPIPTGLGYVTLIYGLIPSMAGRNRVKSRFVFDWVVKSNFLEIIAEVLEKFRSWNRDCMYKIQLIIIFL